MKVPVTALIAIKLDLLLRREKTEQSILVVMNDSTQKQLPSFGHKPSFEKEQFKEFKMNFVNEIVRFVQGNRVCLTDAAYLLVE